MSEYSTKLRALFDQANKAMDVDQLVARMRHLAEWVCAQWHGLTEDERLNAGECPATVQNAAECLRALKRLAAARADRDADAAALHALWAAAFACRMDEPLKKPIPNRCPDCGSTRLELSGARSDISARCMDCDHRWLEWLPFFQPPPLPRSSW